MKRLLCLFALLTLLSISVFAQVSDVKNVVMTPANPLAGDFVNVTFTYDRTTDPWNQSYFLAAVSSYTTFQAGGTSGQIFKVANGSINIDAASAGSGYGMGDGNGTSIDDFPASFNFNIPSTLEGGTYYIVVGGKMDFVDSGGAMPVSQNYVSFTVPLPAASASITKTAENTTVQPGDYVLFTVDYTFVNTNSFIITDTVPLGCTLVEMSPGGTSSGTAAGSSLTWNIGNATNRKNGKAWFLALVDSATVPGTVINNTASWSFVDTFGTPANGTSNTTVVTVAPPFKLLKSQSVSTAAISDIVTYSFDFELSGLSLKNYTSFDTDQTAEFFKTGGTFTYTVDAAGGGYIKSPAQGAGSYPHFLKTVPNDFAYGEIVSDLWIGDEFTAGADNWDALITFRDNGLAGTANKAYGAGISSDGMPAYIYVQESNPVYYSPTGLMISNAVTIASRTWYTIKILVTDAGSGNVRIQVRVWPRGTIEPAVWHINWTDIDGSVPAPGYVGFQGHEKNPNLYDNFKIFRAPIDATNAVLFDSVPAEITYVGGTIADAYHGAASYDAGTSVVSWLFPGQVVDYTAHIEWWGTVNACGSIINTGAFKPNSVAVIIDSNSVTIDAQCPGTPTITETITPTSTITITVTPTITVTCTSTMTVTSTMTPTPILPVLSMSKSVAPGTAATGETITYTIRVRNTGLIAADNVIIWDTLPPKHTYISGGVYNAADRVVNYSAASIATGAFMDFSFTAMLDDTINKKENFYNTALSNCDDAPSAFVSNQTTLAANVPDLELKKDITYPNPTDGEAIIVYHLSVRADVTIKVFTISGETVRKIDGVNGVKGVNKTLWDGMNDAGERVSSGVYIYKIEAVNGDEKKYVFGKMAVMK